MRSLIPTAVALALCLAAPVMAQTTIATTKDNVSAFAVSGVGSGSGGTTKYSGLPVASAVAPSALTSYPCVVPRGGAVQTALVGASLDFSSPDKDCKSWTAANVLDQFGKERGDARLMQAAVYRLCEDDATRKALREAGEPCPVDQARFVAVAAPALPPAPAKPGYCAHYERGAVPPKECE